LRFAAAEFWKDKQLVSHVLQYKMQLTLQHTATHCNTLQHTATHCNTPQQSQALRFAAAEFWEDKQVVMAAIANDASAISLS